MCIIIVVNQFSRILIIYYLILHRIIITLQHRVTKYIIIHSINSVVVAIIIGERTNNKYIYIYIWVQRVYSVLYYTYRYRLITIIIIPFYTARGITRHNLEWRFQKRFFTVSCGTIITCCRYDYNIIVYILYYTYYTA